MTDWTQQPPPPTLGGRMRAAGRGAESMLAEEMDAEHLLAEHRAACEEIKEMRSLLSVAGCPTCDGRGWYVEPGHACRNEQECMERCPEPMQVQCEWCARRDSVTGGAAPTPPEEEPF